MRWWLWWVLAAGAMLSGCGGGGPWNGGSGSASGSPSTPQGLAANAGDGSVSLGWAAPASGATPFSYSVSVSPSASSTITRSGTSALVRGLSNGTTYTFSVTASNADGSGDAATVSATPGALDSGGYSTLSVQGDSSSTGVFDPALLRISSSAVWLAYASSNYTSSGGYLVENSSVRLALSQDNGATFTYVSTPGAAGSATVTDSTGSVCGAATCSGRWVYAAPWLVDDSGDSDTAQRYKLFAHKYFLYPAASPSQQYALGAVVMWTAAAPNGTWSAEQYVLGWDTTPPELTPLNNVDSIDSALSSCVWLRGGSASARGDTLDFVFACGYGSGNPPSQKIVLLRSDDHAASFSYVATLLDVADATALGADYFTDPALLPGNTNAPVLIASPAVVNSGTATLAGCRVYPIASEDTGTLFTINSAAYTLLTLPAQSGRSRGACAWDRGLTATGILFGDENDSAGVPFSIIASGHSL